jgi:hypothetical protein
MSNQFKAGDPALIVGANSMVQNIGKSCELIQFVRMDEFYVGPNGVTYQHADVPCWIVTGDGLCRRFDDGSIEQSEWGLCEPRHLRPLLGDFAPEQTKSREVPA